MELLSNALDRVVLSARARLLTASYAYVENWGQVSMHNLGNTFLASKPGVRGNSGTTVSNKNLFTNIFHLSTELTHLAYVILSSKDIQIQNKYSMSCVLK